MKKAKIIINDEVNCKVHELDLNDRRALQKMFEFEKPGARYLPSVRLGRWNGKVSYFSLGGSTFVNLLEPIITYLYDKDYDIELIDHRANRQQLNFSKIEEDSFSEIVWPEGHTIAGQPILLRDYQVSIINNFLENPQSLQEVATGAGKTLITAALSKSVEHLGRSIVIVPNKSLVVQTEADYINLGLDTGVYFGDRKEYGKTLTICTWQSLNNLVKNINDSNEEPEDRDIAEFLFDGVVCVIVDECFDGDSKVLTPNGYVPIKDIMPGDKVINYSETEHAFKEDTVIKQHKNLTVSSTEKMYELEFDNGTVIRVTGNHKFLTNMGWCRADELNEDHVIVDKT